MSDEVGAGLPPHWLLPELAEVAVLVRGVSYKKEDAANVPSKDLVPVLRATNITGSGLTFDSLVYVPARYVSETQYIRKGDIVIASSSGSKEVVGKSGQVPNAPVKASFGAFCTLIRPEAEMDDGYLGLYFQSPVYREAISEISAGSNINNIKSSELNVHRVPVPPRAEQTRIVEKLEELLSDLDAGVAELKAAQFKLAQYRQSLLKAAVEGALTADWRAARARSGEPQESGADLLQRILTERRARWEAKQLTKYAEQGKTPPKGWQAKYPEPLAPDTSALSALPEGWSWASIDQIASVGTGVTPLRSNRTYFEGGTIPWITSGALNDEFVTEASEYVTASAMATCRLELFPAGSLLVAMYGEGRTRGKCAELTFPSTINQAIAAVVLDDTAEKLCPFVKAFFWNAYEAMRKQASGGVQPNLNLQIIKSLAIPIPPIDEQAIVEARLTEQLEHYDHLGVAIEVGLHQAAAQRKNILKAAFAGQLVPQDPNDEPASALLERIRAERAKQTGAAKPRGRKPRTTA